MTTTHDLLIVTHPIVNHQQANHVQIKPLRLSVFVESWGQQARNLRAQRAQQRAQREAAHRTRVRLPAWPGGC